MEIYAIIGIRVGLLLYAIILLLRIGYLIRGKRSSILTGFMLGITLQITYIGSMLLNPLSPDTSIDDVVRTLVASTAAGILILCVYRAVKVILHCYSLNEYRKSRLGIGDEDD